MRTLNTAGAALYARLLAGEQIDLVPLVYLGLPVPQRWALAGRDVPWGADVYTAFDVGLEGGMQDETGTPGGLSLAVPAVTPAQIALAADGDVEGAPVLVYLALVDPANGQAADALQVGAFELDQPGWEDGLQAVAHFAAESRAAVVMRPNPSRYTNDEQQRLYPGDTSLNFDPATDAGPLNWPNADYYKVPV